MNTKKIKQTIIFQIFILLLCGISVYSQSESKEESKNSSNDKSIVSFWGAFPQPNGCVLIYGSFDLSMTIDYKHFFIKQCGASWEYVSDFKSCGIDKIHFISNELAWVACKSSLIKLEGKTGEWKVSDKKSFTNDKGGGTFVEDVFFINEEIGWISTSSGGIFKTEDGGINWQKQQTQTQSALTQIRFTDENFGWASDDGYWDILITKNGGKTWENITRNKELQYYRAFFTSAKHGCLNGLRNLFCTFNGETWEEIKVPESFGSEMFFIDDNIGWTIGSKIYKTTDGGKTWQKQFDIPDKVNFPKIIFTNKLEGWAWVCTGKMWNTTDGGENWNLISDQWMPTLKKRFEELNQQK